MGDSTDTSIGIDGIKHHIVDIELGALDLLQNGGPGRLDTLSG